MAPSALAAFGRLRQGLEPIEPDPELDTTAGFLYQLNGEVPDEAAARALDAYFIVGADHGFNASTFTARVITSTRSDIASAVAGATGALKGPLHGGAPSEVVSQLNAIGSPEAAEEWINDAIDRGERLMGFGHRVYRAYDPARRRAARGRRADELHRRLARARRGRRGRGPARARGALSGSPARRRTWSTTPRPCCRVWACRPTCSRPPSPWRGPRAGPRTAIEQAAADKLIRPDVIYTGPAERHLPGS